MLLTREYMYNFQAINIEYDDNSTDGLVWFLCLNGI